MGGHCDQHAQPRVLGPGPKGLRPGLPETWAKHGEVATGRKSMGPSQDQHCTPFVHDECAWAAPTPEFGGPPLKSARKEEHSEIGQVCRGYIQTSEPCERGIYGSREDGRLLLRLWDSWGVKVLGVGIFARSRGYGV